jgi:Flp pilus assembly pilin Flp
MKKMFLSLWNDEAGFIVSAELILVATLLVIGMIVGLQTVRDTVITELADTATAIGQINQSYSYGGVTGHNSSIAGSFFADASDFCDSTSSSTAGTGTGCTSFISTPATAETPM